MLTCSLNQWLTIYFYISFRDKYYDYHNDDYYYDDDEFYDDYYDYDLPLKSRQKSKRRQGNNEVDRQYGGKNELFW